MGVEGEGELGLGLVYLLGTGTTQAAQQVGVRETTRTKGMKQQQARLHTSTRGLLIVYGKLLQMMRWCKAPGLHS